MCLLSQVGKTEQKPSKNRHQQLSLLQKFAGALSFYECQCRFAQVLGTEATTCISLSSFVSSFATIFARAASKKPVKNRLKASKDAGFGGTSAWTLARDV